MVRSLYIERAEPAEDDSRTVELAFASDTPIEHWSWELWDSFELALSMEKKAMRTERLAMGAPLLMDHDHRDQVGVVRSFTIDKKDGKARASVEFSTSARASEIYDDVKRGIRQCVSVGFMIWEMHLEEERKDKPSLYRSDDWEPYEISIVSVPADISVGVGRSLNDAAEKQPHLPIKIDVQVSNSPEGRAIPNSEKKMKDEEKTPETPVENTRSAALESAREISEFGKLLGAEEVAKRAIAEGKTLDEFKTMVRESRAEDPAPPPESPASVAARTGGQDPSKIARVMPRHGVLRNFKGEGAEQRAYRFGHFLLASVLGFEKSRQFCEGNGIKLVRAMGETVNEKGGFLVPEEFGNDLIDLREQYGVFRRNAKVVPMASDTRSDPRRTGGLTAYFVGEAEAITASDLGWDRVELVAKKLGVLARYSSEVNEDSAIAFGDTLAGEIAYAFAEKEDQCGFNGTGSSTFGGIVGVREKLKNVDGTIANIAGLQVGSGNAYSELVLADLEGVVARLPQHADTDMAAWYVHRSFYWNVMVKLLLASGGVTAAEVEDSRRQRFMGYRVEFSQALPKTEASSQVCVLFGDLAQAASFGSRRDTTIALSEHSRFANDQIEIRGTERFDINVHDVGNTTDAGPIVGLITAAS